MIDPMEVARRRAQLSDAKRALLAQRTRQQVSPPRPATLERRPDSQLAPASSMQEQLWYVDQADRGTCAYNIAAAYRVTGKLDPAALERSLSEVISRHAVLRTSLRLEESGVVQVVSPENGLLFVTADLGGTPEAERDAELQRRLSALVNEPFTLESGPLFRSAAFRLDAADHVVAFVVHHSVFDGESVGVFLSELAQSYEAARAGKLHSLPPLIADYGDFSYWQRTELARGAADGELSYWKERLGPELPALALPADRVRPARFSYEGKTQSLALAPDLCARLEALARGEKSTRFMVWLGTLFALLHRFTGQEDLVVGSAFGLRGAETEKLLGFFANTVALRIPVRGDASFRALLAEVRAACAEALAHRTVPFDRVVQELKPARDRSRTPIFQAAFFMEDRPETFRVGSTEWHALNVFPEGALTDLTVMVRGSRVHFQYYVGVFEDETIRNMLEAFETLVRSIVERPDAPIAALPILSEAQRRRLIDEYNVTATPLPNPPTIVGLVEAQVDRTPTARAVAFGGQTLQYGELERRANQFAHYLAKLGVGRGALVGVGLNRGLELPIALLGVLKAGAAYVPIDPDYPEDRIAYVLSDSNAALLVTESSLAPRLGAAVSRVVCIDEARAAIADCPETRPAVNVSASEPAYVIYTSGSTGNPKGVSVHHGGAANFLASMAKEPGLGPADVIVAVTTLSFDIAVLELYLPLTVGATTVIVGRETAVDGAALLEELRRSQATVLQATPTTWQLLLEAGWDRSLPLKALCGGEAMPQTLATELLARAESVWNMYGPTETTVWSTCQRVESGSGPIPIGRPIDNTRVYVLDRHREIVPPGASGELYIGGAGVALGYLNRPELTTERFLADPFASEPDARMYKTGDAVRFRHDGSLEYLERLDQQVKVRGYRIELGEIEAALASHPDVARAAVVVREDRPGDKRLVGYVVVKPQRNVGTGLVCGRRPAGGLTGELRDHLKKRLPDYMVVSQVVELGELPLTSNGKVDKKCLPAPSDVATDRRPDALQPRTVTERHVAAVWSSVLGVSEVGADDNFFNVGGHSLLAVRLSVELSRAFGIEVSLGQILSGPTIAEIARVVDAGGGPERVAIVPLRRGTLSPPLFCICGINLYHELAKSLGPDLSVYGIFVPAEANFLQADRTQTDEGRQALPTVEELAAAYVEAIRSKQPCGPYRLAGLCFGGLLAYEAARQLEAAGERVELLALLEIVLPSAMHWRPARWVTAHLNGFRHEGLSYVTRRLEPRWATARARLLGALGAAEPHTPPAPDEVVANDARLADIRNDAYQHAMRLYDQTPNRYGGNVVIFRAIDEPFFAGYAVEPDGGFSRLVSGKIDVHNVPGDHLGILARPHVTKLTAELGRYVEAAALSALVAPAVEA